MQNNQTQIASAIVIAGLLVAGAILLKGNISTPSVNSNAILASVQLDPVTNNDYVLGTATAPLTLVVYEDFQCPYCEKFVTDTEQAIRNTYVTSGKVKLVYRDYAFLGPESVRAAEAARCAGDQGKFWEYHDYLFSHQNGENKGGFADKNLKSFAKDVGLDTNSFNSCFDSKKYEKAVADSTASGSKAGVNGTPKGFFINQKDLTKTEISGINQIVKDIGLPAGSPEPISLYTNKNIVSLNGALPGSIVTKVIDVLLK